MTRIFIGTAESRPAGWTVLGIGPDCHLALDPAIEPLPFPDNSVDAAMVCHTLQGVPSARLAFVLAELRRVIKPGGWRDTADGSQPFEGGLVRFSVPDLSAACRAYVESNEAFFAGKPLAPEPEEPIGVRMAAWLAAAAPHQAFDHETLQWWLKRQGFDGMYRSAYRKSLLPELRVEGVDHRPHDSLFIEAWKSRRAA